MIEDNIRRKIEDLIGRSAYLVTASGNLRDNRQLGACKAWIAEAVNVIELTIPTPTNAYRRNIVKAAEQGSYSTLPRVAMIAEMLRALLPDIDAGLLGDLGNKIRAETFDEFLEHAESYRKEGRKNEAGVIAGVVFEDTIRRICQNREIEGHKLEDLINALAKEGAITKQQSKQAKVASDVRISATHARWEELNIQAVEATIQFTKSLLRDHLGG